MLAKFAPKLLKRSLEYKSIHAGWAKTVALLDVSFSPNLREKFTIMRAFLTHRCSSEIGVDQPPQHS